MLSNTTLIMQGKRAVITFAYILLFGIFNVQGAYAFFIPEGGPVVLALPPCHLPISGSIWTLSINLTTPPKPFAELRFATSPRSHNLPPFPRTITLGQSLSVSVPCCWFVPYGVFCHPIPGVLPAPPVFYGSAIGL